jgi:hypothetical protein
VRRYSEIAAVLVKGGFVDVVDALQLRPSLAVGRRMLSAFGRDSHAEPSRAVRLRLALGEPVLATYWRNPHERSVASGISSARDASSNA